MAEVAVGEHVAVQPPGQAELRGGGGGGCERGCQAEALAEHGGDHGVPAGEAGGGDEGLQAGGVGDVGEGCGGGCEIAELTQAYAETYGVLEDVGRDEQEVGFGVGNGDRGAEDVDGVGGGAERFEAAGRGGAVDVDKARMDFDLHSLPDERQAAVGVRGGGDGAALQEGGRGCGAGGKKDVDVAALARRGVGVEAGHALTFDEHRTEAGGVHGGEEADHGAVNGGVASPDGLGIGHPQRSQRDGGQQRVGEALNGVHGQGGDAVVARKGVGLLPEGGRGRAHGG